MFSASGREFIRGLSQHVTWFLLLAIVALGGFLRFYLRRPIFYDRTLIWASIPLYLLLAAGMHQLRYWSYTSSPLPFWR